MSNPSPSVSLASFKTVAAALAGVLLGMALVNLATSSGFFRWSRQSPASPSSGSSKKPRSVSKRTPIRRQNTEGSSSSSTTHDARPSSRQAVSDSDQHEPQSAGPDDPASAADEDDRLETREGREAEQDDDVDDEQGGSVAIESPGDENEGSTLELRGNQLHTSDESDTLLTLLYSIAEDQARKDGYVHRSITCNHCGTSPIRGFRFKCANCIDYDLCETCEPLEVHYKTHTFLKIRIPIPPLANARAPLTSVLYPGIPFQAGTSTYDFTQLQKTTHFDVVELEALYDQFRSLSTVEGSKGGITKDTFEYCLGPLGVEKNLIIDRIFSFFDQDDDGIISFEELVFGSSILCKGSLDERIKYAFKGYDLDGDGFISREELRRMLKSYLHLTMELVRDVVKTMEEGMMESFDDEAAKPVSASFYAPIQSQGNPSTFDDEDDEEEGEGSARVGELPPLDPAAAQRRTRRQKRMSMEGDFSGSLLLGVSNRSSDGQPSSSMAAPTSATGPDAPASSTLSNINTTANARSSRLLRRSFGNGIPVGAPAWIPQGSPSSPFSRPESPTHATLPSPHMATSLPDSMLSTSDDQRRIQTILQNRSTNVSPTPSDTNTARESGLFHGYNPSHGSFSMTDGDHVHFPVMEEMSQDAIEEMVDKTFQAAKVERKDYMSFEEFKGVVEKDSNLLSWFESLGSVF